MSLTKRVRVLLALLRQEWHQQTCGECKATWWALGPAHPELIRICDDCELRLLDTMWHQMEDTYQQTKDGRIA